MISAPKPDRDTRVTLFVWGIMVGAVAMAIVALAT